MSHYELSLATIILLTMCSICSLHSSQFFQANFFSRPSLPASDWAGRRMRGKGRAADACLRGGGDGRGARWRRLRRRRAGGRGAGKWS